MIIRNIVIKNFRGIKSANIKINKDSRFICFIGPGDSGKTTILTAINFALFPYYALTFYRSDFYKQDTSESIEIIVSVGELPNSMIKNDEEFAHFYRYCNASGDITDEIADPATETEYEKVISIKLSVNDTMEPNWSIFNERLVEPIPISGNSRNKFNVYSLDEYSESHFTWGRYSPLAKMSTDPDIKNNLIATMLQKTQIDSLVVCDGCDKNGQEAECNKCSDNGWFILEKKIKGEFAKHGLEDTLSKLSPKPDYKGSSPAASVSLCADEIPIRLNGKGTCRLSSIALQKANTGDDSIILIDEIEFGLEPYRLRNLIRSLRLEDRGQIIATTHSNVAIEECSLDRKELHIINNDSGDTSSRQFPQDLKSIQRACSEAFLSRKIIVTEGKTEIGFLRGVELGWQKKGFVPVACKAASFAYGGGGDKFATNSRDLRALGYEVFAIFDSDLEDKNKVTYDRIKQILSQEKIPFVEWDNKYCIEQRICNDVNLNALKKILQLVSENFSSDQILSSVIGSPLYDENKGQTIKANILDPAKWGLDENDLRRLIGNVCSTSTWFKDIDRAEELGVDIYDEIKSGTPLHNKLVEIRSWIDHE